MEADQALVARGRVHRGTRPALDAPGPGWVCACLTTALSHLVGDLQLVVSELATNAMVHAATSFEVTLTGSLESVLLEVLDGGQCRSRASTRPRPWRRPVVGSPSWTR